MIAYAYQWPGDDRAREGVSLGICWFSLRIPGAGSWRQPLAVVKGSRATTYLAVQTGFSVLYWPRCPQGSTGATTETDAGEQDR